jgi:PEP-CTERM motif-containing protein
MKSALRIGLAAAAALTIAGAAKATVVTFDDLPGDGVVPDGYAGITWNGQWNYYLDSQPPYTPESSPTRVYDLPGVTGAFEFSGPVVFDGAYFAGFESAPVTFEMLLGGVTVATSGTLAPSDVPAFLSSGYGGLVDTVIVHSPEPDFFVMDDVTFHAGGVPEPASWALMIAGMGLAGATLRRRRVAMA